MVRFIPNWLLTGAFLCALILNSTLPTIVYGQDEDGTRPPAPAESQPSDGADKKSTEGADDPDAKPKEGKPSDPKENEKPDLDKTGGDPVAPADVNEKSDDANESDPKADKELPIEDRTVYIPFSFLDGDVFRAPGANVIVPQAEYDRLLKAWRESLEPVQAPNAVISKADYIVTIDEEIARIRVTLTVDVLGKSWTELPIRFGAAAIGKMESEGALLKGTGNGTYSLVFKEPGTHTVSLELATQVHHSPDGAQLTFDCPTVAITNLDVTVPKKDQSVVITPKVVALPVEDAKGDVTQFKANIGATQKIAVRWSPKASLKPEMDLLTSVTNETAVAVEDGLVHTDTWLTYDILRGSLDRFRIAVPKGHRILDIAATTRIKSWKATDEENRQLVEIELLSGVDKPITVDIHTEYKLEGTDFNAAGLLADGTTFGIHSIDAVRESGQIAVRKGNDLSLTLLDQQGVVRIQKSEVRKRLATKDGTHFKFYSPNFTLKFSAKPVEPRVFVNHSVQHVFTDDELRFSSTIQYDIQRAGLFKLELKIPKGFKVDTVNSPAMKEFDFDEEAQRLTVSLNQRTQGAVQLVVRGHADLPEDGTEIILPVVEPLNVERETGTIQVFARESMELKTNQDNLAGAQPLPAARANPIGAAVLNSMWSFSRRPVTIPMTITRKPTRLSSKIGTTIDVQPDATHVRTQLDFIVEYAGVDTFRFEVPESISEGLQIELEQGDRSSAPIKQQTSEDAVDGWVTWTVITQREVLGKQRFVITYDVQNESTEKDDDADADADEETEAPELPELVVLPIRPLGMADDAGEVTTSLSQLKGEVSVTKERTLSISAGAEGGGVEAIDVRELTLIPQDGALAFRYYKADADDRLQVTVTQTRHEIQEVVSTVISKALIEVVTGEDAEATYRCRMNVKSTERQRLLVHLPIHLEILATFVNEREVKLEKADVTSAGEMWAPFWVNVARTESSDEPFILTFQFLWDVKPSLGESQFGRGRMTLPLPIVGADIDDSVIQETKVVVWVPKDYALIGDPNRFEVSTQPQPWSVLLGKAEDRTNGDFERWVTGGRSASAGFLQFPTEGRNPYVYSSLGGASNIKLLWWNRLIMTFIVSGAIAIIGWILMRTSWENKLGILVLAAFAASVYGIRDAHALHNGIYVARYGILALLALWLINILFGWKWKTSPPVAAVAGLPTSTPDGTVTASSEATPSSTGNEPSADGQSDSSENKSDGTDSNDSDSNGGEA